jgi:hypothetical protein
MDSESQPGSLGGGSCSEGYGPCPLLVAAIRSRAIEMHVTRPRHVSSSLVKTFRAG